MLLFHSGSQMKQQLCHMWPLVVKLTLTKQWQPSPLQYRLHVLTLTPPPWSSECSSSLLHLLTSFLFDLQQVHLETLLHLPSLLLSCCLLRTKPGDLSTSTHTHTETHKHTRHFHHAIRIMLLNSGSVHSGKTWDMCGPLMCSGVATGGPVCSPELTPVR